MITTPPPELLALEAATDWHAPPQNHTFLLPGESTIDGPTMRRRIAHYYRQIRGASFTELANRAMLKQLAATLEAEAIIQARARKPHL